MWWRQQRRGLIKPSSMTEDLDRAQRCFVWVAITSTIIAILLIGFALARDGDEHSMSPRPGANHAWFDSLESGKGRCCADADGDVVKDADWTATKDGHYRVLMFGEWVTIPDDAVITVPNLDGRTILWPIWINGHPTVRCFMPGSMT
jgi:hypothetical protein